MDYYYPLNEISGSTIYEFKSTRDPEGGFFYKISRNADGSFSQVYYSDATTPIDSTITRITDSGIETIKMFRATDKGYLPSIEEPQLLYPKSLRIGELLKMTLTHEGLEGIENSRMTLETGAKLKSFNSDTMTVSLQSNMVLLDELNQEVFHQSTTSIIKNKRGVGMVYISISGEYVNDEIVLTNIMTEKDWEQMHISDTTSTGTS